MFPILNPPPSSPPYHPSGSFQCTSPKHPVLCIEPGLATRFIHDILHVSRNHAKAETPILWPPHVKSYLIGKDSDAGRDWGQEEKGTIEDEMAGWHHWLDGPESEWTPGVGDAQGGLTCCNSWGHKESDKTERLNSTELNWVLFGHSCQLDRRLTAIKDHLWALVLFGHSCPLVLKFVWCKNYLGYEVLFEYFAYWLWCVFVVEDCFWALTAIWAFLPINSDVCPPLKTVCEHEVLFGHSCQLVLTSVYCWGLFVSTEYHFGILPIGSDVWLPLRTICFEEVFV